MSNLMMSIFTTSLRLLMAVSAALLLACTTEPPSGAEDRSRPESISLRMLDPPSGPGALAPNLSAYEGGIALTWLEPAEHGHTLRLARLQGEAWGSPETVASGGGFFANWADLPQAIGTPDGTLFAHWLAKLGEDTYAYGVQLARSLDDGMTWQELGLLHDDASPTEHGFVSYAGLPGGGVQAFWLDGRAMPAGGSMHLRTTRLAGDGPGESTLLDERVCECCATDAAMAAGGPVVVYRDRSDSEIRDIAVVRATTDGWSEPTLIHDDGWQIHGCPVNGPAIAADGDRIAIAWFTAAKGKAKVQVAHSVDGGVTFGEPVLVDDAQPLGRVDIVMAQDGGAVVSWLGTSDTGAELRWRKVSADGPAGPIRMVSTTTARRSAGVPRMIRRGDELLFVWVEDGEVSGLRAGLLAIDGNSIEGAS